MALKPGKFPGWNPKLAPIPVGKERRKKKPQYSSLAADRLNEKGHLHTRHVLSNWKVNRSLLSPARILRIYIEDIRGFRHYTIRIISITYYSLKVISLKQFLVWKQWVNIQSNDREGDESPTISWLHWHGHILLMTIFNTNASPKKILWCFWRE